jgi:hypothetical protein
MLNYCYNKYSHINLNKFIFQDEENGLRIMD